MANGFQFTVPYDGPRGSSNRNNVAPPFLVPAAPPQAPVVPPPPPPPGSIGETYIPDYDEFGPVPQAPQGDIGPGIPLPPNHPTQPFDQAGPVNGVTSVDLPQGMNLGGMEGLLRMFRGGGVAPPPPSRRYAMGVPKTDFIYTNPASAQQAAASLLARIGYDQGQEQGYRQYQIAQQQNQLQQGYQAQRAAEAEKDRALQREGFASSERSAAARGGYGQSEFDMRNKARQDEMAAQETVARRDRFRQASSIAAYLNNPNVSPMEKSKQAAANSQVVHQGPDGIWRPSEPDPDAAPPPAQGQPVVPIETILPGAKTATPAPQAPQTTPPAATPMFPGPPQPPAAAPAGPGFWGTVGQGLKYGVPAYWWGRALTK